jgi:hypothetical protein
LRPSSGRISRPRAASRKMFPRRPLSTAPRRKARRSRKRNATPPMRILSPPLSTRTLGNLLEAPIYSTRCSRSRAPIIRDPSSTPLRNAPCFGVTFTGPGHLRRVAGPPRRQEGGSPGRGIPRGPRLLHDLRWASGERLGSAPQARASGGEREMCPWAISKYFGDLVSNTCA